MKKFLLVLVGAFLIIACHRKVDLEAEKTKVKEVLDQYLQMLKTENVDLLSKLTAHDADMVSFGTATNERIVGWEAMKEFMEIQFETTETAKISSSDQVIKIHDSGKVAWFSEILDWEIVVEEQSVKLSGIRVSGVLEKRDGNWVYVQLHYSIPAAN